jgi:hypothetical protein
MAKSMTTYLNCEFGFHWHDSLQSCSYRLPVVLEWNGKVIAEKVPWFQYESDASLNSNVFEVAQGVVQKHLPG